MLLENVTTSELTIELKQKENSIPKPVENPDFSSLIEMCVDILDEIRKEKFDREDNADYIYEEVMESVFGDKIWNCINEKIN